MSNSVSVDINRLIIGRELRCPVRDPQGVLLLAAGVVLTPELKRRLVQRGVTTVVLEESDAGRMLHRRQGEDPRELRKAEQAINERVEAFLRNGQMSVRNTGPALSERVVKHGRTGYDQQRNAAITSRRAADVDAIASLLETAETGGEVSAEALETIAHSSVANLLADFGNTLSAAFGPVREHSLAEHATKMSTLGMAIGIEMGFDLSNVRLIGIAGLLADVGMAQVPPEIREARRRLTDVEFVEIQKHAIRTANVIEKMHEVPRIVQIVAYQVHECLDGSGYPRRRTANSIHPFARVLHVADAYAAMTAPRPDRPAIMPYVAMETLLQKARKGKVEGKVVRALLHALSLFPVGSHVALSDGSAGCVVRSNGPQFGKPIVARVTDSHGDAVAPDAPDAIVDLLDSDLTIVQALPAPGSNEVAVDVRTEPALAAG